MSLDSRARTLVRLKSLGGIYNMLKVDYDKLRQYNTEPIIELEEQLTERMRREQEAKLRDEKGKGKKKRRPRR